MTEVERPFLFVPAPDRSCWGKWFLPLDATSVPQAAGRNIADFEFGGLYQELVAPKRADYPSEMEWHEAHVLHMKECEAEEVEMFFTDVSIVFIRPYPEWNP